MFGLFFRDKAGAEHPVAIDPPTDPPTSAPTPTPTDGARPTAGDRAPAADPGSATIAAEVAQLRADLLAEREARATESARRQAEEATRQAAERTARITQARADADTFALRAVTDRKILPHGKGALAAVHQWAALAASGLPTDGVPEPIASLATVLAAVAPHHLTIEAIPADGGARLPSGARRLDNGANEPATLEDEVRRQNDEFFARQGVRTS